MDAFPLKWPAGQKTSSTRQPGPFKTTPGRARDELIRQLKLLKAKNVVITTNVATYKRAGIDIPYADQPAAKENPGVAVYYTWQNEQYCLACDKWKTVMDNMQALAKTVDAIRGIDRWGSVEMVKAAFQGFKELQYKKAWYEVLGVSPMASKKAIKAAYISKSKQAHPDAGGTKEAFQELSEAYQTAMK